MITTHQLLDNAKCFETIRSLRWPEAVTCPHRGISQTYLPIYLGFFEFVHNAKKRGKVLLGSLLKLIIS